MSLNIHIAPSVEAAVKFAHEEASELNEYMRDSYVKEQERKAELGINDAEMLIGGHDPFESMSWDNTSGSYERRLRQHEYMRANGMRLEPQSYRVHGGRAGCEHCESCDWNPGQRENVYTHQADLDVIAAGLNCTNCKNWLPKSLEQHEAKHGELSRMTGVRLPAGREREEFIKSHCCWCGTSIPVREGWK